MTQNTPALSHSAAPGSLSAQARPLVQEQGESNRSELPARPSGVWVAQYVGSSGLDGEDHNEAVYEVTRDGFVVAEHLSERDARHIARCVNSHGDLLAALRNLVVMLPSDHEECDDKARIPAGFVYIRWQDLREARAAINRATS